MTCTSTRAEPYNVGDMPTITGTFLNLDDELTDPIDIDVTVREPDGSETTYDDDMMTHVSTGIWSFTFPTPLDSCGFWTVKFFATEGLIAAEEISFKVKCSRVG